MKKTNLICIMFIALFASTVVFGATNPITVKHYESFEEVLKDVPKNIITTDKEKWNKLRIDVFNKSLDELQSKIYITSGKWAVIKKLKQRGKITEIRKVKSNTNYIFLDDEICVFNNNSFSLQRIFAIGIPTADEIAKMTEKQRKEIFDSEVLKLEVGQDIILNGFIGQLTCHRNNDGQLKIKIFITNATICKPKPKLKPTTTTKPKSRTATTKPVEKPNKKAKSQLGLARSYKSSGLNSKAIDILMSVIENYPKTLYADAAKKELKKIVLEKL